MTPATTATTTWLPVVARLTATAEVSSKQPVDETTAAVETGPVDKATAVGTATHVCELHVTPPSRDLAYHFVEVVRGGDVIAQGMGDDLVDALLDVIAFMLPPDHEEYPGVTEN